MTLGDIAIIRKGRVRGAQGRLYLGSSPFALHYLQFAIPDT
jgi:hypothetical protein